MTLLWCSSKFAHLYKLSLCNKKVFNPSLWNIHNIALLELESYVSASECPSLTKKWCIIREPNYEILDQACHIWFLEQRSKGALVSGPVLREKALQLFALL